LKYTERYRAGNTLWLLKLENEHKLLVFENSGLRKIWDEMTGKWRRLSNE